MTTIYTLEGAFTGTLEITPAGRLENAHLFYQGTTFQGTLAEFRGDGLSYSLTTGAYGMSFRLEAPLLYLQEDTYSQGFFAVDETILARDLTGALKCTADCEFPVPGPEVGSGIAAILAVAIILGTARQRICWAIPRGEAPTH